ncbi:MAG: hypothetical protein ACO33A_06240 [Hyphomonas sp.]
MKPSWLRQTRAFLSAILAASAAGLPSQAEVMAPDVAAAPVITRPAFDLPLRPGERLLQTADGACSVVVFAPHEERYERFAAYWSKAQWIGDCRFGLVHGDGRIVAVAGNWTVDASMLYGTEVGRSEVAVIPSGQAGGLSWSPASDTLNYFSGAAFSDSGSVRYTIRLDREPLGELELGELGSDWYGSDYLERYTFDTSGRETAMSISIWSLNTYCGLGLPDEFKRFEKEVKKACNKSTEKLVLIRREGFVADLWSERPITWLKSCPVNKASRLNDCGQLVEEALGKEGGQLEKLLTEGDSIARRAAEQEIINRYADLEARFGEEKQSAEPLTLHDQAVD